MSEVTKVFISYSHDSEDHKSWVYDLACRLVRDGIDTILDQWDIALGSNLSTFMEKGLTNSDRVLVICTDSYNKKSNEGLGGVGYEKNILTTELLQNQDTTKFIPCICNVTYQLKTPTCLSGRMYLDFSNDLEFETSYNHLLCELYGVSLRPKPELGKNPFSQVEDTRPSIEGRTSVQFFGNRFAKTFPSVRGIERFRNTTEIIERLEVFFRQPFDFRDADPIWWWGYGNCHIDSFRILSPDTILINQYEFVIDELAAVNALADDQAFIYLQTKPSQPSGLYDHSSHEEQLASKGYVDEEFAVYRGRSIKRTEHDDGSAVIDGKVVDLNRESELRIRYLTPYNLLIAPQGSRINNNDFDEILRQTLNDILTERRTLEELLVIILRLPKNRNRDL